MQKAQAQILLEHAQERKARLEAKENFLSFCIYMHENLVHAETQYLPAAHHIIIIKALQKIADNPRSKLTVAIPPGAGKSVYASILFPCWLLARNPKALIICASYGDDLAHKFSRQRRSLMISPQWQNIADSSIDKKARSVGYTATVDGGSIKAVSASGSVSGHRCDYLVCDDLVVGHEAANSPGQLQKIKEWYLSEARTRMKPLASEVIIGTRWSVADPIAVAMEFSASGQEKWTHIRLPLVCDDPKNDLLGRKLNERLWPSWFTPEHISDAQRDPLIFKTLQQQLPHDDRGLWCPPEHLHRIKPDALPKKLKYFIAIDMAWTSGSGDFTVIMLMALDDDRNLYIVDTWREQVSGDVSASKLVSWCAKYHPSQVLADSDQATKNWSRVVLGFARDQHVTVPLHLIPHMNKAKEERASNIRSYLMLDKVQFVEHLELNNVIEEVLSFPGGKHDDCIDCLSLAGVQYVKMSSPVKPATPSKINPSGVRGSLLEDENGVIRVRSTLDQMFTDREQRNHAAPDFRSRRI